MFVLRSRRFMIASSCILWYIQSQCPGGRTNTFKETHPWPDNTQGVLKCCWRRWDGVWSIYGVHGVWSIEADGIMGCGVSKGFEKHQKDIHDISTKDIKAYTT